MSHSLTSFSLTHCCWCVVPCPCLTRHATDRVVLGGAIEEQAVLLFGTLVVCRYLCEENLQPSNELEEEVKGSILFYLFVAFWNDQTKYNHHEQQHAAPTKCESTLANSLNELDMGDRSPPCFLTNFKCPRLLFASTTSSDELFFSFFSKQSLHHFPHLFKSESLVDKDADDNNNNKVTSKSDDILFIVWKRTSRPISRQQQQPFFSSCESSLQQQQQQETLSTSIIAK